MDLIENVVESDRDKFMNIASFFMKYSGNIFVKILRSLYIRSLISNTRRVAYIRKCGTKIGNNCYIGSVEMFGSEPYLIEVGDNVYFSGKVNMFTHDGGTMQLYHMGITNKKFDNFGKIKIGNNCFLGANCTILKNVTIGDNCIVGTGAVVTKSIPDNSVVAGVPATIICSVNAYYEKNRQMYDDTVGWNPYKKRQFIEANMAKYEKRRQLRDVRNDEKV